MRIVLPLLNSSVTLLPGHSFYLSDEAFVENLDAVNHGAIYRLGARYQSKIKIDKTKCIIGDNILKEDIEIFIDSVRFTLNILCEASPIEVNWAGIYANAGDQKFETVHHVKNGNTSVLRVDKNPYKIKKVDRKYIQNFFRISYQFCKTYSKNTFVIKRFNMSLDRDNLFDRIVDTCICIEALISGNTELTYRTGLYISKITETDPEQMKVVFQLVKKLYSARSKIVHGDYGSAKSLKLISFVEDNWAAVESMVKSALSYYILFAENRPLSEWNTHLENVIFGSEKSLIDEEV